jgi:hypothetical protein
MQLLQDIIKHRIARPVITHWPLGVDRWMAAAHLQAVAVAAAAAAAQGRWGRWMGAAAHAPQSSDSSDDDGDRCVTRLD